VTPMVPIALIVMALQAPVAADPAGTETMTLRCTNPSSGTTWDVAIDHRRQTADSFPADISDTTITWHDASRGGYYEFDRASGELTVIYPSSMGGFFLKDNCRFVQESGSVRDG
jgi:hypothetical protein